MLCSVLITLLTPFWDAQREAVWACWQPRTFVVAHPPDKKRYVLKAA